MRNGVEWRFACIARECRSRRLLRNSSRVPVGSTSGFAIKPLIFGLAFDRRRGHRIITPIRHRPPSSGGFYGCASNWFNTGPATDDLPGLGHARFNTSIARSMGPPRAKGPSIVFSNTITWWHRPGGDELGIGRIRQRILRMRCRPPTSSPAGFTVALSCRRSTRSISTATMSPVRPMPTKLASRPVSTCCKRGKRWESPLWPNSTTKGVQWRTTRPGDQPSRPTVLVLWHSGPVHAPGRGQLQLAGRDFQRLVGRTGLEPPSVLAAQRCAARPTGVSELVSQQLHRTPPVRYAGPSAARVSHSSFARGLGRVSARPTADLRGTDPCRAPRFRDRLHQFSQPAGSGGQTLCGSLCLVDFGDSPSASHGLVSTSGGCRVAPTQRIGFPVEGARATCAETVCSVAELGPIVTRCADNAQRRAGRNRIQKLHDVLATNN